MEGVKEFLKENKLDVYINNFDSFGYDDMGQLLSLKTDELMSVATESSIEKPGHRKRFVAAIEILKSSSPSLDQISSSTSPESENSGNDKSYIQNQEDVNATEENDRKKLRKSVQGMHISLPQNERRNSPMTCCSVCTACISCAISKLCYESASSKMVN